MVNLIRWLDIDPETPCGNLRFRRRFAYIKAEAAKAGKQVDELSFEEMDALWEAAKTAIIARSED